MPRFRFSVRALLWLTLVVGLGLAVPGCGSSPNVRHSESRETDTNFDNHRLLAAGIAKADKVSLYEGLPHQLYESELLRQELKSKETVIFNGFPFYAEALGSMRK